MTNTNRTLFVSIPVADIGRSRAFFAELGFDFDPQFSGETAACMRMSDHASIMFLDQKTFGQFAHKPTADPATQTLALYTFSVASRDEVDSVSATALAAGATEADGAEEHGNMYSRSFHDLDGHPWQVMWMGPAAAQ